MPRKRDEFIKHEYAEITFYVILILLMAGVLPFFVGFSLKGFEESFVPGRAIEFGDSLLTYIIYYFLIVIALIGLPVLKLREMALTDKREHPANQRKPGFSNVAYLHDPEQDGLLYNLAEYFRKQSGLKKNFMSWSNSMIRVFVVSILFFGIIGLLQTIFRFQFVGIKQIAFQATPVSQIFFAAEPASSAETMTMIFVFSLMMGINAYFSSKLKLGKIGYFGIGIIICLVIGFGWMGFHNLVYGNDEASLLSAFIFGFVGSLLTLLFGSFIPWYVWHYSNNSFAAARKILETRIDDIVFFVTIGLVVLLITWISVEVVRKKIIKKMEYNPLVPT